MAQDARRICLTGPECTGKTTLAERLAREFDAQWVPEFAREYAVRAARELTAEDVEPIARGQMDEERRRLGGWPGGVPRRRPGVGGETPPGQPAETPAFLDTDLLSTVVYARHYYGACPSWIEDEARSRKADLYLLLDIDVPWLPDPARDASDVARAALFEKFRNTLDELETNWTTISGGWEERAQRAIDAITRLRNPRDRRPGARDSRLPSR